MTDIVIRKNKTGFIVRASGHAGYAEKGKDDIVCASISMLCYTLVKAVHDGAYQDKPGEFYLTCQGATEDDFKRLKVIVDGFRLLENDYRRNVRVTER